MAEYTIDKIHYGSDTYLLKDSHALYLTNEGNLKIDGTIAADQGIFNKLIATNAEIENLNVDDLTAQNATVVGLLDVQGNLHTNSWTNSNIATIQGNFYIAPTIKTGMNLEEGVTIQAINNPTAATGWWTITLSGTNILTVPNLESDMVEALDTQTAVWSAGSKVMITGSIIKGGIVYPLGTLKGKLSNQPTSTGVTITNITDNINNNPATLQEIGANSSGTSYGYQDIQISLYERSYEESFYPLGILLSAQGRASKSFIDIYNGANIYWDKIITRGDQPAATDYGGLAMPVVRIGNLRGLPNIKTNDFTDNGFLPTGWGIYTSNGFFSGTIVSNNGLIGGFTLDENSIANGNLGSDKSVVMSTGIEDSTTIGNSNGINTWAFAASNKFGVTTDGTLYASVADITGDINANKLIVGKVNTNNISSCWQWDTTGLKFIQNTTEGSTETVAITNNGSIVADSIKTGTLSGIQIIGDYLKLGGSPDPQQNGTLEIFTANDELVGRIDNTGLKFYDSENNYVSMNYEEGFSGYNSSNTRLFWSDFNSFGTKTLDAKEEIIIGDIARLVPIQITSGNTVTKSGFGIVAIGGSN